MCETNFQIQLTKFATRAYYHYQSYLLVHQSFPEHPPLHNHFARERFWSIIFIITCSQCKSLLEKFVCDSIKNILIPGIG